jgi:molybdenum cofactor guanylyltransferase
MGRDKSKIRLGNRTFLGHIRATAKETGFPLRIIRRDRVPRCGPLGGIFTALSTSQADAILFLPCDMPFISATFLNEFLSNPAEGIFLEKDGRAGFPILIPRRFLPLIEEQLEANDLSLHALAEKMAAKRIHPAPHYQHELQNVNTPEEWAQAARRWRVSCHS